MKKSRKQAIKDLTLMLLYLTRFQDNNEYYPYEEISWKHYDTEALNELEKEGLLYQPDQMEISYLSEEGKTKAKNMISEYGIADKDILEKFGFRAVRPEEEDQVIEIERICFPPNEACSPKDMKERMRTAPDYFLTAIDQKTGKIAGYLTGIATTEYSFRDEFFTDASFHNPDGPVVMILGLEVLPEYRGQGLARELMSQYQRAAKKSGKKMLILTCLPDKVGMYQKFGFLDRGISNSRWGGEEWHEMTCILNLL